MSRYATRKRPTKVRSVYFPQLHPESRLRNRNKTTAYIKRLNGSLELVPIPRQQSKTKRQSSHTRLICPQSPPRTHRKEPSRTSTTYPTFSSTCNTFRKDTALAVEEQSLPTCSPLGAYEIPPTARRDWLFGLTLDGEARLDDITR